MIYNEEYLLDLCVRMAHHSTAIEGNTLTQDETASIILNGIIARQTSEREFYEVKNYRNIIPTMLNFLKEKKQIDNEMIKIFYSIIMQDLIDNNGMFKTIENMIIGANFEPVKPYLVQTALKDMNDNLYYRLKNNNVDEKIIAILQAHINFEKIHPFSDGNGRVGRLLIIYSCLEQGLIPIVIPKDKKNEYIAFLRNENLNDFLEFAKKLQELEQDRYLKFKNLSIQKTIRI